jgi:hypothetical protein
VSRDWDEAGHPRHPSGSSRGGRFRRGSSSMYRVLNDTSDWAQRLAGQMVEPGYRPGAWQPVTPARHRGEWIEEVTDALRQDGMRSGEARSMASEWWDDYEPPTAVYANGPHRVILNTANDRVAQRVPEMLEQLDDLYTRFPGSGPVRLAVAAKSDLDGGLALHPSSVFYLSEDAFDDWTEERLGVAMPAARQAERWRYILAHEWGHVADPTDLSNPDSSSYRRAAAVHGDNIGALSPYGQSNETSSAVAEGRAEAFAEWYLTRGRTGNRAAQGYAAAYGWRWE